MRKLILLFLLSGCVSTNDMNSVMSSHSLPDHIDVAIQFIDYNEFNNRAELKEYMGVDPYKTEWCAAFVNAILNSNGIPGSESVSDHPLLARSFLRWGQKVYEPRIGDIVIFPRGNAGWQGHVGFYMGSEERDGKLYYMILGGNQDDKVSLELFPAKSALGIRRHE